MPLYHKIRIPYEDIIEVVTDSHEFLANVPPLNSITGAVDFEWDIYLTTVNDLKADLQACGALKGQARLRWLTRAMPRFMWRATALSGTDRILDLSFEATDIHTSNGVYGVLCYEEELAKALPAIAASKDIDKALDSLPGALRVLRWVPAHLDLVA